MKLKYSIVITALILIVAIQWYRPHKNVQSQATPSDFLVYEKAPEDVKTLYTKSCYDCHSNYTDYKWFDHIAPISWYVDRNIKNGSFALNFSNWEHITDLEKEIMFAAIPFNINSERMPTTNYIKIHPEARLSEEEKSKMITWLIQVKEKFLEEGGGAYH